LGGGLFGKLKAMVEPENIDGQPAPKKQKAEAIYEDDEMAGGPGSQASIEPPKMPFRATFEKKGDDTK